MNSIKFCEVNGDDLTKVGGANAYELMKWNEMQIYETPNSGYDETDPNSHISLSDTRVTLSGVTLNEVCHVTKDLGASAVNGFVAEFEAYLDTSSTIGTAVIIFGYANTVGARSSWATTDGGIQLYKDIDGVYRFSIVRGNNAAGQEIVVSGDTLYYCRVTRADDSDTVYLYIYSNESRTTLVDSVSVAGFGTGTKWRYRYLAAGLNVGFSTVISGYAQYYNLAD